MNSWSQRTAKIVSQLSTVVIAALAVLAVTASTVGAVPAIERPVVDEVGVFSPTEVDVLETRLRAHHDATGVQMAVLVVETTGPRTIEQYSMEVAESWEGGSAERDDGVLFVLAIGDRENRLELGYGIEPLISDSQASRILDSITPDLRDEHYAAATGKVVDDVIAATDHLESGEAIEEAPFSFDVAYVRDWIGSLFEQFGIFGVAMLFWITGFLFARRRSEDDWRGVLLDARIDSAELGKERDVDDFDQEHLENLREARTRVLREETGGEPADIDDLLEHELPDVPGPSLALRHTFGEIGCLGLMGLGIVSTTALWVISPLPGFFAVALAVAALFFITGVAHEIYTGENLIDAVISSVMFGGASLVVLYNVFILGSGPDPITEVVVHGSLGLLWLLMGYIGLLVWLRIYRFLRPHAVRVPPAYLGGAGIHGGKVYSTSGSGGGSTYSSGGFSGGGGGSFGGSSGGGFSGGGGSFGGGGASGSW